MNEFFKGWNFRRILYLLGGIWMITQSIYYGVWWFSIFGLYFVAMSVFKFGCASGNCGTGSCEVGRKEEKI